jgi:hypothetical protein
VSVRAWRDLVAAQFALLKARWRVRRAPVGGLVVRQPLPEEGAHGDPRRARAIATAVVRAAEHGVVRPTCLIRVLALQEMLHANGIRGSAVRVGVRRANGEFTAHAWIVWRGEILGDRPEHVAQFVEVDDLRVLAGR